MTKETCMDLADEMGIFTIDVLHCLNCGEIVDPLILKHRMKAPAPMKDHARVALKTALAGDGSRNRDDVTATCDGPRLG